MNKLLRVLILLSSVVIFNKSYSQDCNAMPVYIDGTFETSSVNVQQNGWDQGENGGSVLFKFPNPVEPNNIHISPLILNPYGEDNTSFVICGTNRNLYPSYEGTAGQFFKNYQGEIPLYPGREYTLKFNYCNVTTDLKPVQWEINFLTSGKYYTPITTSNIWLNYELTFTVPFFVMEELVFSAYSDLPESNNYIAIDNITLTYDCTGEEILPNENVSIIEECKDCSSFKPLAGEKYIVSGWARLMQQAGTGYQKINTFNYENVYIGVSYFDQNNTIIGSEDKIYPLGEIIDGWQRIQSEIMIPNESEEIKISLVNENAQTVTAFFDDIRVHPFNGNLKSFVYDQETQKLMAELDENNYATFYEYDKEGGLVRVKKETEKGVFTIQETRSSTFKK